MVTINASILLIALPAIFRGLGLGPLAAREHRSLLWMMMGFLLVTAVLVVPSAGSATCTAGCGCTTSASPSSRWARSCSSVALMHGAAGAI